MKLQVTNTQTRKKEPFEPIEENKVKMYVCGITPYDYSHIGHGRSYVNFDVLYRFLQFLGFEVTYARNITDIDDKLLNRAEKELGDMHKYKEVAQKYTKCYHEDMRALNCLDPDVEPRATEHVEQMIAFIKELIEKKHAYVVDGDVYFDVTSFKDYGKLSGKKLEDLQVGARIKIDKRKKNPEDFVLWKGNDKNEFWETPWGYGRPGWHLECSVMSRVYLGDTIDIHGGGMDLVFPHHENEVAQSECLTEKTFVKYWLHNAFVNINKEKMSKSLGNFFTLRIVFEKFDPMVLRFFFLQHQYKMPLEFNLSDLQASETTYKKLVSVFAPVEVVDITLDEAKKYPVIESMCNALCDDLNTPKLFGILFENLSDIKQDESLKQLVKSFLARVLGLTFEPIEEKKCEITPEMQELIAKREQARKEKDWGLADKIRDQLRDLGYEVQDKPLK